MELPENPDRIEWVDISRPLAPGGPVWPGDAPTVLEPAVCRTGELETVTTALRCSLHAGTHLDAPRHFVPGGATVDRFPPALALGAAMVVDATGSAAIGPGVLPPLGDCRRVLFKTRSEPPEARFSTSFSFIEAATAAWLRDAGVVLAGLDTPSVDPFDSADYPAHRILLGAGVYLLENLRLDQVSPGRYLLLLAPLPLLGAEASPVRPFLGRDSGAACPGGGSTP